jgi:hypothetical protein
LDLERGVYFSLQDAKGALNAHGVLFGRSRVQNKQQFDYAETMMWV